MDYNGYTNESTYLVDLYLSNTPLVNDFYKTKCFKGIDGFKKAVIIILKKDGVFFKENESQENLKNCDWLDLFDKYSDDCLLVESSKDLLKHFTAENDKIFLPDFQLDRDLYLEVKETIESYGYKYVAGSKKRFEKKGAEAQDDLNKMLNGVEVLTAQKQFDFYPTPNKIVLHAQTWLKHDGVNRILEPSCGTGNLILGLEQFVDAIEINPDCVNTLKQNNINVIASDFETFETDKKYKFIIMNPPFSKFRDAKHILKAYELLEEGGTLVAVASGGILSRSDKESLKIQTLISDKMLFNDKEFKQAGTSINTVLIKIINCKRWGFLL